MNEIADPLAAFGFRNDQPAPRDGVRRPLAVTEGDGTYAPELVHKRMSEIPAQEVRWLWPQRIPAGKLVLLVGTPCTGKTFVALDLAARLSIGSGWPDNPGEPGTVGNSLIISGEDAADDTLVPRLTSMRADLSRIRYVYGVRQSPTDDTLPINLDGDLRALENGIEETEAALVVLDPLSAFLGKRDSHRDSTIRGLLTPLAFMAERTGATILGIVHLNKSRGVSAIERIMGSTAFGAAARAVYLIAKDEADDRRRLFVCVKNNLARETPPGLSFSLDDGRVLWGAEPIEADADALVNSDCGDRCERAEAAEWLEGLLLLGAMAVNEIKRAAEAEAIAWRTLRRAKQSLGVTSRREGYGKAGRFVWELPAESEDAPPIGGHDVHRGPPTKWPPMDNGAENAVSPHRGPTLGVAPNGRSDVPAAGEATPVGGACDL